MNLEALKGRSKFRLFGELPEETFAGLKAAIGEHGVLVPIEVDEAGEILDGHERVRACLALGMTEIPAQVRAGLSEAEKPLYVRKINLLRRQLDRQERRAVIAAQLQETPSLSDRGIAAALGVDHHTVAAVRQELVGRGEIPHVATTIDTLGREQPRARGVNSSAPPAEPVGEAEAAPAAGAAPAGQAPGEPAAGPPKGKPAGAPEGATEGEPEAPMGEPQGGDHPDMGRRGGKVTGDGAPRTPEAEPEEEFWALLAAATPTEIAAALVEHVDGVDWSEVAIRLVCEPEFDANGVVPRLSEAERHRSASAFQGAINQLRVRHKPVAAGSPPAEPAGDSEPAAPGEGERSAGDESESPVVVDGGELG
jgi:hypothetical protein